MNAYMLVAWNPNETVRVKSTTRDVVGTSNSCTTMWISLLVGNPQKVSANTSRSNDSARLYGRTLDRTR